jgi:hypothetical protein
MHTVFWLENLKGRNRPLGKPRRRWEDNIRIHFREVEWEGLEWINVAQDMDQWRAIVSTVMNLLLL